MRAKDMGRGGERLMTDICLVETSKWKQSSVLGGSLNVSTHNGDIRLHPTFWRQQQTIQLSFIHTLPRSCYGRPPGIGGFIG